VKAASYSFPHTSHVDIDPPHPIATVLSPFEYPPTVSAFLPVRRTADGHILIGLAHTRLADGDQMVGATDEG
jgi:hypothetical protein